jgi:hypothetical protein
VSSPFAAGKMRLQVDYLMTRVVLGRVESGWAGLAVVDFGSVIVVVHFI